MKKLTLVLALIISAIGFAKAETYKIDEQQLDGVFSKSKEVTFEEMYASDLNAIEANFSKADGERTRGGFLVRCFFCGSIAIHRYYMGCTKGARMFALYFCVPIGPITACVDFWWVVFDSDAFSKYEGSDKYLVWID